MKMTIKENVNRIRRKFLYGYRSEAKTYVAAMNRMGACIDESVYMPVPETVLLDKTTPYLLEIGKNAYIAQGVKIYTHDASWLVAMGEDGILRGHTAPVSIGNNVFLGVDSVVLCDVSICDNVIVGAKAVVNSNIREPGVYVGNPAKMVKTLEQFKAARESRQLKEAYKIAQKYVERFGKAPSKEIFSEYFWLFEEREIGDLPERFYSQMTHSGNEDMVFKLFRLSEPIFDGYERFWEWCQRKMKEEKGQSTAR